MLAVLPKVMLSVDMVKAYPDTANDAPAVKLLPVSVKVLVDEVLVVWDVPKSIEVTDGVSVLVTIAGATGEELLRGTAPVFNVSDTNSLELISTS